MPDCPPSSANTSRQRLWSTLAAVPRGYVVTYGQLAELAGMPRQARRVGTLLSQLPTTTTLPWHRVINARGRLSFPVGSSAYERQCARLQAEEIPVIGGKIDLKRYRWHP